MRTTSCAVLFVAISASACNNGQPEAANAPAPLPAHWLAGLGDGGANQGLAKDYPADLGIQADPHVIAAEGFESGAVSIATEENRYAANVTVTSAEKYTGQYAAVHSWPTGLEGVTTRVPIPAWAHEGNRPTYFARMCFNFDKSFHPGDLSLAVGVKGFGIYFEDGSGNANTCAGMSWYDVSCQFVGWGPSQKTEANDGFLWVGHLYSYNRYPRLAVPIVGDVNVTAPPDGTEPCRFSSYATPFEYIRFNTWRCYELGLYLNTPGVADGEARFWIDGVLQSRTGSMRFRDRADQLPTSFQLNLYRTTPDFPQTMVRWADNIVLATRYIGPPAAM
jgi:hypothetical protein